MKKIILMLTMFASVFTSIAHAKESVSEGTSPQVLADIMSNFETIGAQLNFMKDVGLVSQFEYNEIVQILKDKNVSLDDQLIQPQVKDNVVSFGNKSLSIEGGNTFKTQDGVYIRFNDQDTMDKVFLKSLSAFSEQKTSLFKLLILPDANAQSVKKIKASLEAIGASYYAALSIGFYHVWKSGATIVKFDQGISGLLRQLTEGVMASIAHAFNKTSIICDKNVFKYDAFLALAEKRRFEEEKSIKEWNKIQRENKYSESAKAGYDRSFYVVSKTKMPKIKDAKKYTDVPTKILIEVFKNQPKPLECNDANVTLLKESFKVSFNERLARIKRAFGFKDDKAVPSQNNDLKKNI